MGITSAKIKRSMGRKKEDADEVNVLIGSGSQKRNMISGSDQVLSSFSLIHSFHTHTSVPHLYKLKTSIINQKRQRIFSILFNYFPQEAGISSCLTKDRVNSQSHRVTSPSSAFCPITLSSLTHISHQSDHMSVIIVLIESAVQAVHLISSHSH
jgi:hypothetical protein